MLMKSPYVSKAIDVPDALVESYKASGFVEVTVKRPPSPRKKAS